MFKAERAPRAETVKVKMALSLKLQECIFLLPLSPLTPPSALALPGRLARVFRRRFSEFFRGASKSTKVHAEIQGSPVSPAILKRKTLHQLSGPLVHIRR